jgi:CheY-like chemotaxis protein
VIVALDGLSALAKLDSSERIDCLIVDLVMPKGHPNGISIGRMARQKRRELSVIYMTGRADLPQKVQDAEVLLKPVDPDRLIREIAARLHPVLEKPSTGSVARII